MSIHNLNLVIFLSLSVAFCGQVVAQDGSGTTTTPAAQAAPAAQAPAQVEPAVPNDKDLKEKFGLVFGFNVAGNFKSQNPDADAAQILEGIKAAEGGVDKSGYVFGYNAIRNFKSQNPDADVAQVLEGIKAAEDGVDKSGYVFGYQLMSGVKEQNAGLTSAHLEAGIKKAIAGEELGMSSQETQMIGMAFSQMIQKKQREKQMAEMKKKVDDNKAKGEAYVTAQKAANPNIKELGDGVYYEVLKEGTGEKPGAKATVSVDYTGRFIDGEVFDSSVKPLDGRPAKPLDFQLSGGAIPGFLKALSAMSVGSKWRVIIPGEQAYGMRSRGKIGPMQMLIFEIEMLKVVDSGEPAADKAPAAAAPVNGK